MSKITLLGVALLCVAGLHRGCSSAGTAKPPTSSAAAALSKAEAEYSLSDVAERVKELLDREAFTAADGIFNAELPRNPDDAGLHIQYARYLILTCNTSYPGYINTPLVTGDTVWGTAVVARAALIATQLDPESSSYVSAVILHALDEKIRATFATGEGIIYPSWTFVGDGFWSGMLPLAYVALETDPETSSAFGGSFRELMEQAIQRGKLNSAVALGNLVADLEHKGEDNTHDFEYASDAFLRALSHCNDPNRDQWIQSNIQFFSNTYGPELIEAQNGNAPEAFLRLQESLEPLGFSFFEESASDAGM